MPLALTGIGRTRFGVLCHAVCAYAAHISAQHCIAIYFHFVIHRGVKYLDIVKSAKGFV